MNNLSPMIISLAALSLLAPVKNPSLAILRNISAIYFLFLIADRASRYSFALPLSSRHLQFSFSIPLLALSFIVWKIAKKNFAPPGPADKEYRQVWVLTIVLIFLHMLGLGLLLQIDYGYGWHQSPVVLGHLIFYLFLFVFYVPLLPYVWPQLLFVVQMPVSLIWRVLAPIFYFCKRPALRLTFPFPHVSVLALLAIHLLSLAISPDVSRSLIFTLKLLLAYLVGYSLLRYAIINQPSRKIVYLALLAVTLSLFAALMNIFRGDPAVGFQGSPFKYATFQAILLPLTCVYLILDPRISWRIGALLLVIAAALTTSSLGMLLGIPAAFLVTAFFHKQTFLKMLLLFCVFIATVFIAALVSRPYATTLSSDANLYEPDGQNIKQRYLEWQALINLLEDRAVTGSGAGCVNHYRSEYYHRLPKLNTIEPFDQNGYLALAAECGVIGLVCFIWILFSYFKNTLGQIKNAQTIHATEARRCALASLAGLTGAATAHFFSSVHYSGVIVAFVVILVLIDHNTLLSHSNKTCCESVSPRRRPGSIDPKVSSFNTR